MAKGKKAVAGPSARPVPRPLGPDSQTWNDFGSYRFHLMLPQAFMVQTAHPVIDAGVAQHSVYRTDPWGRARRSARTLWPVIYARPEVAIQKGKELRELHRSIRGVASDGSKYHALDPEAYAWVHVTGFDSAVRMHELFGTPPTREQRKKMFEEWRQIGSMLGIADEHIPRTEEAYWDYFEGMIRERLVCGEVLRVLLSDEYYAEHPKPPIEGLSDDAWNRALRLVIAPLMKLNSLGTLPKLFRERFDIPWTDEDERRFEGFRRFVRAAHPLVPERRRYIPLAWRAICDARENPEAYRWSPPDEAVAEPGARLAPA